MKKQLKSKMSVSKCRDKLKKLGYEFTQEGQTFIVKSPKWDGAITFHSAYWLGNWCHYHLALDKPT